MEHIFVKYEYQPKNYEQYRYFCECKCGFQTRLATEQAAKSQFDAHLMAHGEKPYFDGLEREKVVNQGKEEWSPFGGTGKDLSNEKMTGDLPAPKTHKQEWKPSFASK
jgi:hypothetical protein